jgi:hypothetical protein
MGYHLSANIVSRGSGGSIIAKAAYNSRESILEQRTGELKDYSRHRDKPMASFVFAADPKLRDATSLWQFYDAKEMRTNAQVGISFIGALPAELTDQQRENIVKDFSREQFLRKGVAAQADIHRPDRHGDERNFHVHMLVSMRKVGADGLGEKAFTWADKEKNLDNWREKWAARGARELEKAGFKVAAERWRYGHLPNDQQREKALERGDYAWAEKKAQEPTTHLGPAASGMERKGEPSERSANNREIAGKRKQKDANIAELAAVDAAIAQEEARLSSPATSPQDALERLQDDKRLCAAGVQAAERLEKDLPADRKGWGERMLLFVARAAKSVFDRIADKALEFARLRDPERRKRQQPTAYDRRWQGQEHARAQAEKNRGRDL